MASAGSPAETNTGVDADAPVGPSEAEESAFIAEQREQGVATRATAPVATVPEPTGELPPLDELVARIPAPTRALIDEMFRAKFVAVRRLPPSAFKS
ncbi:MAG TPA: hypothetical protein VHD32_04380 [Candidatus Didemnitutus sp.]|nr:hypothetical protein [Candidatus Didemnitutus sp.]